MGGAARRRLTAGSASRRGAVRPGRSVGGEQQSVAMRRETERLLAAIGSMSPHGAKQLFGTRLNASSAWERVRNGVAAAQLQVDDYIC